MVRTATPGADFYFLCGLFEMLGEKVWETIARGCQLT